MTNGLTQAERERVTNYLAEAHDKSCKVCGISRLSSSISSRNLIGGPFPKMWST